MCDKERHDTKENNIGDTTEETTAANRCLATSTEFPGDLQAFYGHPLTAAASVVADGSDDHRASALALLHEYQSLPPIPGIIEESFKEILKTVAHAGQLRSSKCAVKSGENCPARPARSPPRTKVSHEIKLHQKTESQEPRDPSGCPDERDTIGSYGEDSTPVMDIKAEKLNSQCSSTCAQAVMSLSDVVFSSPTLSDSVTGCSSNDAFGAHVITADLRDDKKPSDSTKRIMQALTDKISQRKQNQNNNYEELLGRGVGGDDTLYENDIRAIISESFEDKTNSFLGVKTESYLQDLQDVTQADATVVEDISYNNVQTYTNASNWPDSVGVKDVNQSGGALGQVASSLFNCLPVVQTGDQFYSSYANTFPVTQPMMQVPRAIPLVTVNGQLSSTQDGFSHLTYPFPQENSNLKSPDSGYNENMSPVGTPTPTTQYSDSTLPANFFPSPSAGTLVPPTSAPERTLKRRRSSLTGSQIRPLSHCTNKMLFAGTIVPKLENNTTGYECFLETPISTSQRIDEDRMTYLNKDRKIDRSFPMFLTRDIELRVELLALLQAYKSSIIMVVFRDDKTVDDENKAWDFWHSRQHSIKQRILDVDTKNSSGILSSCVDEISLNAVVIRWNPREQPAKVSLAVNCLSTDFSNQKGVKGFPLHVQVDTFEEMKDPSRPIHRGFCQIKIFCDKGAERKARDEERRKDAKVKKKSDADLYHSQNDRSPFYDMANVDKVPLLFNPVPEYMQYSNQGKLATDSDNDSDASFGVPPDCSESTIFPAKRSRSISDTRSRDSQRVLLYVREEHEEVFNALLLLTASMEGLARAIEEKYRIPVSSMKNIYKRSRKGILVKMDNNIIQHYANECTFIIDIKKCQAIESDNSVQYTVTLEELDTAN